MTAFHQCLPLTSVSRRCPKTLNSNQLQDINLALSSMRHKSAIKDAKNRTSTKFRFFIAVVKLGASISIWIFIGTRERIARNKDSNFMGIFYDGSNANGWCNSERKFTHAISSLFSNYSSLTICKGSRTGNSGNNLEFSVLTLRTYVPWFPPPSHKPDFEQPLATF